MANTSGSINTIIITRDQLITEALQDIRQFGTVDTIPAADMTKAALKLNMLIKKWQTKGLLQWCRDTLVIPMQVGKISYTIGPVGADFTSYRPLRAVEGSFLRIITGGQPFDTPLTMMSRVEYQQLGNKAALGVMNCFYYQPTMGGASAYNPANSPGTLYVYTTAQDTTRTIYLEVQRPIQDVLAANDALDFPVEWYEAIVKSIGAAMGDVYEIPEQRLIRIKQEAKALVDEITDYSATEDAPFWFQPDTMMMGGWQR
jgi:hypothetical protein